MEPEKLKVTVRLMLRRSQPFAPSANACNGDRDHTDSDAAHEPRVAAFPFDFDHFGFAGGNFERHFSAMALAVVRDDSIGSARWSWQLAHAFGIGSALGDHFSVAVLQGNVHTLRRFIRVVVRFDAKSCGCVRADLRIDDQLVGIRRGRRQKCPSAYNEDSDNETV